jgi:hypothetical protein
MEATMRLESFSVAWILGACASVGCAETSTSNYAVAGGFAAAAAALQVAELAEKHPSPSSCNPRTCGGCCDLADECVDGTADEACGAGGAVCSDCVVNGHQTCGEGVCSPGSGRAAQVPSTSVFRDGTDPSPPAAPQPCGPTLLVCFPGTYSLCVPDANGCSRCTCKRDKSPGATNQ